MQAISVDYLIAAQERTTSFDATHPGLRQELARVNTELRNRPDSFYLSHPGALPALLESVRQ